MSIQVSNQINDDSFECLNKFNPKTNLHSQRMVSLIQRIKDIEQEKLILKIEVYEISKHKCITAQLKPLSKEEE